MIICYMSTMCKEHRDGEHFHRCNPCAGNTVLFRFLAQLAKEHAMVTLPDTAALPPLLKPDVRVPNKFSMPSLHLSQPRSTLCTYGGLRRHLRPQVSFQMWTEGSFPLSQWHKHSVHNIKLKHQLSLPRPIEQKQEQGALSISKGGPEPQAAPA